MRKHKPVSTKIPPHDSGMERTLLGSIILDNDRARDCLYLAVEELTPEGFYSTQHKRIFICITELVKEKIIVDIITLSDKLRKKEWLDSIGSEAYLSELMENTATTTNIKAYCEKLKEFQLLRSYIAAAASITNIAFQPDVRPFELIEEAGELIDLANSIIMGAKSENWRELVDRVLKSIIEAEKIRGMTGIGSGIPKLDILTSGAQQGDLVTIAARPGMGKTSLALDILLYNAIKGIPGAMFSLEMSKERIVKRLMAKYFEWNLFALVSGKITSKHISEIKEYTLNTFYDLPISLDDDAVTPPQMRTKLRRLIAEKGVMLAIYDYLQIGRCGIRAIEHDDNRRIGSISLANQQMAKHFKIPILQLSQLSRKIEDRIGKDKKPKLSDLKGSGSIEQDSDKVLFIHRQEYYEKPGTEEWEAVKNQAEIIVAKHRDGPTGSIMCDFRKKDASFYEKTEAEDFNVDETGQEELAF